MSNKVFYLTTTLPYVNSDPHVGFAMEIIRADVIARYHRALEEDVFFNTGTDEHGAKIYENAVKANMAPQAYVDSYAGKFKDLVKTLNISPINFIRTTDEKHVVAAQEMWKTCEAKGDIYKKNYKVKYCVGCELEKTESELVDNRCPIHPNRDIEIREEENYFFKWSNYQQALLDFYKEHPDFVIPDFRFNEIKAFVERGLEDFSISRLKEKMPWGVPVPGDDEHVMYVWFDALTSYISTLGWGTDHKDFHYWENGTPVQYCGKDNLRQQSAMWQAMLMSAGINNSAHIIIDGFITSGGQKMSKSLGNVISPFDVIERFKSVTSFPEDVLRFVLLHEISSFEDGDITMASIEESYQAHLANGIGNLTSRIMKMATTHGVTLYPTYTFSADRHLDVYDTHKALQGLMTTVRDLDEYIATNEPFKVIKTDQTQGKEMISHCLSELFKIAHQLSLYLPSVSEKILECIHNTTMPERPLFERLS
jgi:methionyl-tRNA synthetase